MPEHALLIGGTRFIGRATAEEFLDNGYEVTLFTRGNSENPFADRDGVDHVEGDRRTDADLEAAAAAVEPDVVVDLVAYFPRDVRVATEVFADVDAYVFVSSGAAYRSEAIPKREGETPLEPCSEDQATAEGFAHYGAKKAEGDREVFRAAEAGVNATSVRPPVVYGPHDYTDRYAYWIQRVRSHDRVLLPGDGTNLWHLVFVETVARGIRTVAEAGSPGEAYNVADRHLRTLGDLVESIADAVGAGVEAVTACERELAAGDLEPDDFPVYRDPPHVLSTAKLADLGWEAVPVETGMARTVEHVLDGTEPGHEPEDGPDREAEERVLGVLETL
ncbi:MAG: NAD-dependent epimerase/dehydratase family protein [Haloarculaceae archaeon]